MTHRLLAPLLLAGIALPLAAGASDPDKDKVKAKDVVDQAAAEHHKLHQQFREAEATILRLAQRLKTSDKPDERAKFPDLRLALEKAQDPIAVDVRFEQLAKGLKSMKQPTCDELERVVAMQQELVEALRAMRARVMPPPLEKRHQQRKALEGVIGRLKEVIGQQEQLFSRTHKGQAEAAVLLGEQKKLTEATRVVLPALDKLPFPDPAALPGRRQLEEAGKDQARAENQLAKDDRSAAARDQDDALMRLGHARKKLEELTAQVREEERAYVLERLRDSSQSLARAQQELRTATMTIDMTIRQNNGQKPTRQDEQAAYGLSERQDQLIVAVGKVLELLEADGSSLVLPEVFKQVREDMIVVSKRLRKTVVGTVTQEIQKDISETLNDVNEEVGKMAKDLKKQAPQPESKEVQEAAGRLAAIETALEKQTEVLAALHKHLILSLLKKLELDKP